jgi:uncharacterized protein DUF4389
MEQATKNRLTDKNIWTRGLYMLFYIVAYAVAETILTLIIVFQFLAALITGRVNAPLQQFGANLTRYVFEIYQFATFNSEHHPFPFSDWPEEPTGDTPWSSKDDQDVVQATESTTQPADATDTADDRPPADDATGTTTDDTNTEVNMQVVIEPDTAPNAETDAKSHSAKAVGPDADQNPDKQS